MRLALLTVALLLCACAPVAHAAAPATRLFVPVATRGGAPGDATVGWLTLAELLRVPGVLGMLHAVTASGARGWAVGNDGAIWTTRDGGATWSPQSSGTTRQLFAVAAASPDVAWAGGGEGTILATTDGGATWRAQATGVTRSIRAISAVSLLDAWASGDSGTLLRTVDGGATWQRLPSPIPWDLSGVAATSATSAWIVGHDGSIRHTADGGATWRAQWSPTPPPATPTPSPDGRDPEPPLQTRLDAVAAASDRVAWAVGSEEVQHPEYGRFDVAVALRTTDGGATWVRQPLPDETRALHTVAVGSSSTVWMAGFDSRVHASRDGGATWTAVPHGASNTVTGMTAAGAERFWLVGGRSVVEGRFRSEPTPQP